MVDISDLNKLVSGMTQRHGQARTKVWRDLIKAKNWQSLAKNLLKTHYDPAYDKAILRHNRLVLAEIKQQDCLLDNVKATATHILDLARG
jgi:hypothetical protein